MPALIDVIATCKRTLQKTKASRETGQKMLNTTLLTVPAFTLNGAGDIFDKNNLFIEFARLYRFPASDTLHDLLAGYKIDAGEDFDTVNTWINLIFQNEESLPELVLHPVSEQEQDVNTVAMNTLRLRVLCRDGAKAMIEAISNSALTSNLLLSRNLYDIYKTVFARNTSPMMFTDATGIIGDVNESALSLLNLSRKDIVGHSLSELDIFTLSERPSLLLNLTRALDGTPTEQSLKIDSGQGVFKPVACNMTPLIIKQVVKGVMISCSNISSQERIQEALRESEERFQVVVDNVHEGIIVFDHKYRATYVNSAMVNIFGTTREDILGQDFRMLLPEGSWRQIQNAGAPGDSTLKPARKYESDIVRKNGTKRRVEITSSLMLDSKGQILTIAEFFDITERVRAENRIKRRLYIEEAIAEISRLFITADEPDYVKLVTLVRSSFESDSIALLQIDREKSAVNLVIHQGSDSRQVNDDEDYTFYTSGTSLWFERLLRGENLVLTPSEIRGSQNLCQFEKLFPVDYQSVVVIPVLENALSLEGYILIAGSLDDRNWGREDLSALRVIADMVGKHWGRIRTAQKLRRTEDQLNQSMKMQALGQLAGGVAHDFNNLLTVITGQSDLAMMILDDDNPVKKKISDIQQSAIRGANLTRQLLAFSRTQVLDAGRVDLNEIIRNLLTMLKRLIGEHIQLETDLEEHLHPVRANIGQVEQVIINLVINARDAMTKGGMISIKTKNIQLDEKSIEANPDIVQEDYIQLVVQDTGTGIKQDILNKIFDPFFTTKSHGKGTGLGLSTVYGIVRQADGYIDIQTEIDRGTVFSVYLPMDLVEDAIEQVKVTEVESLYGQESIIVVEDEADVREMAVQVLELYGYNVIEAEDGLDALKKCIGNKQEVDLVVTDMVMPNMGGIDLVQRLREIWPDLRVLLMSGYPTDVIEHEVKLDEKTSFLQKPYRAEELVQSVREILNVINE